MQPDIPIQTNFCQDCRYYGGVGGLVERKCLRLHRVPGTPSEGYSTCLEERGPNGRCGNGQMFERRYVPPAVVPPPLTPIQEQWRKKPLEGGTPRRYEYRDPLGDHEMEKIRARYRIDPNKVSDTEWFALYVTLFAL